VIDTPDSDLLSARVALVALRAGLADRENAKPNAFVIEPDSIVLSQAQAG